MVYAEQGFGDTLQFVRYLPLVLAKSRAARLIFECQCPLVPLLTQLGDPEVEIVARSPSDEALPSFDHHVPLLSLPLVLGCFAPALMSAPYLKPDAELRTLWRKRLGSGVALRVGLAWAGNPKHRGDRRRSMNSEGLEAILCVPDVQFISLQIEPHSPLPPSFIAANVLDFRAQITNFADSAALLAELDLIITVDSAVAHLAGTLCRPVWILLPFDPDWRWGLQREDTEWYPTMRLFRQPTPGNWEAVVQKVAEELRRARK
jgi:hypothetical protein